jgi:hypothetical protein
MAKDFSNASFGKSLEDRLKESTVKADKEAHAAGRASCHGDDKGTYLFFPDLSKRYFPADCFSSAEMQRTRLRYFVRWTEFMRSLYNILDRDEWDAVVLQFGPHDQGESFVVRISSEGINRKHWQEAYELSQRIAEKYRNQDARAMVEPSRTAIFRLKD